MESFAPDDAEPPAQDALPGAPASLRRALNIASAGILLLLLVATASWWIPPLDHRWQALFATPYTGSIVVLDASTNLIGLRASDGNVQWQTAFSGGPVYLLNGVLYTQQQQEQQIAAIREQDGQMLWQISAHAGNSLILEGVDTSHVYYWQTTSSDPGKITLVAANLRNGAMIWTTQLTAVALSPRNSAQAILVSYATNMSGSNGVVAINPRNGDLFWNHPILSAASQTPTCYNLASVVLVQTDQQTSAFDLLTGRLLWQQTIARFVMAFDAQSVYFFTANSVPSGQIITAIDLLTGKPRWQISGEFGLSLRAYSLVIPLQSVIMPVQTATGIEGVARSTGSDVWSKSLSAPSLISLVSSSDGATFFVSSADTLLAFDSRTAVTQWVTVLGSPITGMVAQAGSLFAATDTQVMRLDMHTGKVLWQHQTTAGIVQESINE